MKIGNIILEDVSGWDRSTIADGKWLNDNTIDPLWKNEIELAKAIGENKEVVNLYLKNPAQGEVNPPEYWIVDSDGNVVTKEQMVAWHAAGKYFILNESLDPEMNSRLYFLGRSVCTNQNIWMTFTSVEGGGVIDLIDVNVYADSNGNIYSTGKVKTKSAQDRVIMCKVSYETSPYDVDEGKQLAYLKEVNDELYGDDLYITAEKCYQWMNVKSKILVILGDSESQNYTYYLSSYWNQGTDSQNRRKYRMTFTCISAGDAPKRRLVRTFLSENINSSYSTTKMRMYSVSDPQGIHWCNPSDEVQDLVTEEQVVRVDHNQTSELTDAQKKTARDNIAASDGKISWVKYSQGSQTPVVNKSGISVVTSEQGTRIQNDDATQKFFVAPNFSTPADTGKVFTIDTDGAAKWKPIPTPEKDLTLQMYKDDLLNIGSNTSILKKIYIPEGTTKIEGSINCYPNDGFESISLVLLKADDREYESSANLNFDHLLALDDTTPSASRGQYSNTLNFKFKRNSFNEPFHSLAIKGQSGSDLSNYHVSNIQIMFYKERSDEVSSTNSVTNSENDSENE
jgi:hypothetical protein